MADLKGLIDEVGKLADIASTVLPEAGIAGGAVRIGSKLIGIVEDLKPHAPDPASAATLEQAHDKLFQTVSTKAAATSARLRGQ